MQFKMEVLMSLNTPDKPGSTHNEAIRQEFEKQAPTFADARFTYQLDWMIKELDPQAGDVVLDVAAGTGHIARPLAARTRYVVAIDLTAEMLRRGKAEADAASIHNILFELGDAAHLPYLDTSFDLVTCRFAVHHFEDPKLQLAEMIRVCRPGGRLGVIDMVASPDPAIARAHNRLERLRDQTHTEALSLEALTNLLGQLGAPVTRHSTIDVEMSANAWLASSQTPPERAEQVRVAWQAEIDGGPVTGMRPFMRDDKLRFMHTWAVVVGTKA
jgi:SAM-dependent methyltransferase